MPLSKVWLSLQWFWWNSQCSAPLGWDLLYQILPKLLIKYECYGRNSCIPLCKIWMSPSWFSLNYSNIYPTRCNVTQFILSGNRSTCFGWYHHPSSGVQTMHLQHLVFVTLYIHFISKFNSIHYSVTNTRCCRYSCLRSWWWVVVPPETWRAVSR